MELFLCYNTFSTLCAECGGVAVNEKNQELIDDEMSRQIIATAEEIATSAGAEQVTVRKILQTMGITNRVFYNRFHNIDEVLNVIYEKMVVKIRAGILDGFDPEKDLFQQVIEIVASTLRLSYETKMHFNHYVFANDSVSQKNYEWWRAEIVKLIEFGKDKGYIKDIDTEIMSYSIWCFIRGYNADALGRGIPLEKAISDFKYSFGILLDGMRA